MADETNTNVDISSPTVSNSNDLNPPLPLVNEDNIPSIDLSVAGLQANDFTINYDELQIGKIIGKGSYGKVYQGTYRNHIVAIKEEQIRHKDLAKYLRSEISTLG